MESTPSLGVLSVWNRAVRTIAAHPMLFLLVSALLFGTDMLLWKLGVYDGATRATISRTGLATFLVSKIVVLLIWALISLRLVHDPDRSLGQALHVNRRQAGWIAGGLVLLALLFGLRIVLALLAKTALAPLHPDPRITLVTALLLYLVVSLFIMVRLLPAWAGTMIGDRGATLSWSWKATRGTVFGSIGLILASVMPVVAVHLGNNLLWISKVPAVRAITLIADGAIMAFVLLVSASTYVTLYLRARAGTDTEKI